VTVLPCNARSDGGPQDDEALAVRNDGVGGARATLVAELDASAERVGNDRHEGLTGADSDVPSDFPPFEFAELGRAVRVIRLHAEPTQSLAPVLDRPLELRPKTVGDQGVRLDSIEPDRASMADLVQERERLLVNNEPMPNGGLALKFRQLLKERGRHLPAAGRLRGHETEALEFAQTWPVRVRSTPRSTIERGGISGDTMSRNGCFSPATGCSNASARTAPRAP
jgi:hypothetical protein